MKSIGEVVTLLAPSKVNVQASSSSLSPVKKQGGGGDDNDDEDEENNQEWRDDGQEDRGIESSKGDVQAHKSFHQRLVERAGVLVALLLLQSISSLILSSFTDLLEHHILVLSMVTMSVGAGGNSSNQSVILTVRGLALGEFRRKNTRSFVLREIRLGVCLGFILCLAAYVRVAMVSPDAEQPIAIAVSVFFIVLTSVTIGVLTPLILNFLKLDPAHAGPFCQVASDIFGVLIICTVCTLLLGKPNVVNGNSATAGHGARGQGDP
eukprot:gb/GEZN01009325.1/.p1 GENE.gb/GEZN01009325.1/~~gb/GEZN01009325.1/.p1  ORF type:complete len:265 (+),score=21.07 gb/GEZN01009325.1/:348-1142(+)